jgi:hypothetical protein
MGLNVHVIRCTQDPSTAPTAVGQHWVNTTTGELWFSNGTNSVANWIKIEGDTDEKVKVSANDTTTGFLINKIVAGTNISITEQNDGSNESILVSSTDTGEENDGNNLGSGSEVFKDKTGVDLNFRTLTAGANISISQLTDEIQISSVDTNDDENVKVSANDTTAGKLLDKLTAGSNVTITEQNDGGNESIEIGVTGVSNSDENVKVSSNDTTAGKLLDKLQAGSNIVLQENNDGGDETITISASAALSGQIAAVQVKRDSSLVIPNNFVDVNFTSVGIENDTSVLEYDTANDDRILIKETGLYEISYSGGIEAKGSTSGYELRLRKNDSIVLTGSVSRIEHESDHDWICTNIVAELNAGDFISLQVREDAGSSQGSTLSTANLVAMALKGAKGDTGDTGPAGGVDSVNSQTGTVILDATDVNAVEDTRQINTSGGIQGGGVLTGDLNLSLTDTAVSPGSYTNVNLTVDQKGRVTSISNGSSSSVFGSNAEDFLDTGNISFTTNTAFQAYSFTTASNPAGRYRVAMNVHYEPGSTYSDDAFTLRVDGNQIGLEFTDEGQDTSSNIRRIVQLVGYYQHNSPGTFDIELWANQAGNGNGTTVIHGVQAEVWRVS